MFSVVNKSKLSHRYVNYKVLRLKSGTKMSPVLQEANKCRLLSLLSVVKQSFAHHQYVLMSILQTYGVGRQIFCPI